MRGDSTENTLSDASVEFLVLEVGKKRTPWRLLWTFDHVLDNRDRGEEVGDHWAVIRLEFPFPYDACEDDGQRQSRGGPDPNLVQPAAACFGDVREGKRNWKSISESIAEAMKKEMGR